MLVFIAFSFSLKPIIYYLIELRGRPHTTPVVRVIVVTVAIAKIHVPRVVAIVPNARPGVAASSPLFDIACISQAWRPFNKNRSADIVQDFSGLTLLNFPSITNTSSQNLSIIAHDLASHPPKADIKYTLLCIS